MSLLLVAAAAATEALPPICTERPGKANAVCTVPAGHAVIDLAEAVTLKGREGEEFAAVVTDVDDRGARIQLTSPPVVARVKDNALTPGDALTVRLDAADPATRSVLFSVTR